MKLHHPSLYEDWQCSLCLEEEETFYHIWICKYTQNILSRFRFQLKKNIIKFIKTYVKQNISEKVKLEHNIFKYNYHHKKLDISDVIKGIVPTDIVDKINQHIKNEELIRIIISIVWNEFYYKFREEIWNVRNDIVRIWEINNKYTRTIKRKIDKNKSKYLINNIYRNNNNINRVVDKPSLIGIENMIEMGGHWEKYYNYNYYFYYG